MTTETIFTLPDRDTMTDALERVDGSGDLIRHLYPQLLMHAGQAITPRSFVFTLHLAVTYYGRAVGVPAASTLWARLHEFSRAVISDPADLDRVLTVLADVGMPTGRETTR
jgi:hypothetical protein